MDKTGALKIVNPILACSFLVQVITSIIIFFDIKIPNRESVFEIHEYNGLLLIALAIIHITLNWGWIKANIFKR